MPMAHTQLDGDGRDGDADAQRCLVELDAEQIARINNQGWITRLLQASGWLG